MWLTNKATRGEKNPKVVFFLFGTIPDWSKFQLLHTTATTATCQTTALEICLAISAQSVITESLSLGILHKKINNPVQKILCLPLGLAKISAATWRLNAWFEFKNNNLSDPKSKIYKLLLQSWLILILRRCRSCFHSQADHASKHGNLMHVIFLTCVFGRGRKPTHANAQRLT